MAAISRLWTRGCSEEVSSSPQTEGRQPENGATPQAAKGKTFHRSARQPVDISWHHASTCKSAQHRQGHRSPDSHILVLDTKELPSQNGMLLALGTANCIKWGFKAGYIHSIGSSSIFIRGADSLHSSRRRGAPSFLEMVLYVISVRESSCSSFLKICFVSEQSGFHECVLVWNPKITEIILHADSS